MTIAAPLECAAELIAVYDDSKTRKYVVKRSQNLLAGMSGSSAPKAAIPAAPDRARRTSTCRRGTELHS
jgi:hypothetical protein